MSYITNRVFFFTFTPFYLAIQKNRRTFAH